jgi:nucleotide-binding universal stress UspA family protein
MTEFAARSSDVFRHCPRDVTLSVGEPGAEILRVARERASDFIVLVWKGDLSEDRAQTLQKVLKGIPCPVLIVRSAVEAAA